MTLNFVLRMQHHVYSSSTHKHRAPKERNLSRVEAIDILLLRSKVSGGKAPPEQELNAVKALEYVAHLEAQDDGAAVWAGRW
jgi:hypothetical protein